MERRIHITGASGAGTSTLGTALAARLGVPHFDTDDFYWQPTNPPFQLKRPEEERVALLRTAFRSAPGWVLSGSVNLWGDELVSDFDQVVFLYAPPEERLRRTLDREPERCGRAIEPGGEMYESHLAFLEWSKGNDAADSGGRNLAKHLVWLATVTCQVVKIVGTPTLDQSLAAILSSTGSRSYFVFPSLTTET